MPDFKRIYDKFEYYIEDFNCSVCLYTKKKSKFYKNGCREQLCRFREDRYEAIKNNRIKRKPNSLQINK